MAIETHDKILASAHDLFIKQGYTATSMRQIAEDAGIGKATIYHHFPDKESMVMALLTQNNDRMEQILERVRSEIDPRERIRIAAQSSINFLYESADIIQIVRREVTGARGQTQYGFVKFFREYMALLADAIQKGIDLGNFRPVVPTETARVLLSMIQGTFAMAFLVNERPPSQQQVVNSLLDVYFRGIETC